jgi:hypothetical protein
MRPGEKCENVDAERIKILVGCVTSDISPSSICRRVLSDFLNFASRNSPRYFARAVYPSIRILLLSFCNTFSPRHSPCLGYGHNGEFDALCEQA